jgi:mRNA interferase RelE/StbE
LIVDNSRRLTVILNSFNEKTKTWIKSVLKELENDPFQSNLDIKKIISNKEPPVFRIRIGDYRAVYSIIGKKIMISKIFHRKKGYKWLE